MAVLDSILKKYKVDNSAKELTEPPQRYKAHKTEFRASGNYPKGAVHQMDVLFLPDDKSDGKQFGYRYLLVVSDVGSGKMDARAMKFKKGVGSTKRKASKGKPLTALDRAFNAEKKGVLDHVQDIYKSGKYLKEPKIIQVDAGSEFAEVKKYYTNKKLAVRKARTARHSQQAVVEAMNKMIGSTINKIQLNNQLAGEGIDDDGEVREWLIYLPDIIDALNNRNLRNTRKPVDDVLCKTNTEEEEDVKDEKGKKGKKVKKVKKVKGTADNECETYSVGDKVRIALDFPKAVKGRQQEGKRLYGTFRSGDIRWSLKPHTIENVLLMKNQPIRYVVSDVDDTTFSKFELKPFKELKTKAVKKKYEVEKLLLGTTLYEGSKGKKAWVVRWKGYGEEADMIQYEEDILKGVSQQEFNKLKKNVNVVSPTKIDAKQLAEWRKDKRDAAD